MEIVKLRDHRLHEVLNGIRHGVGVLFVRRPFVSPDRQQRGRRRCAVRSVVGDKVVRHAAMCMY